MLVELGCEQKVWFIGDPHLGKRFENGVPLHRRGEREKSQFAKFKAELATDCDINICVGDLFDHPQVSLATVVEVADAYELAALRRPETQFFVMAGNHDRSRQLGSIGAWEIFKKLATGKHRNFTVVDTPWEASDIVFIPWEWGRPVADQIEEMAKAELKLVVLHHNLESFGGDDSYTVPAKLIMERFPNCERIVTGHYHLPGTYSVDGVDVECTGSLEPFSHAEDPNEEIYVTLTLDELQGRDDLKDKAVRVLLRDGEELPTDLDCLQITGKRLTSLDEAEPTVAERLGAFDWQAILDEHLAGVEPYVREFIDERMISSG